MIATLVHMSRLYVNYNWITGLILMLSVFFPCSGTGAVSRTEGQASDDIGLQEKEQLEHTLLWKIEGGGLQKPSYLFGTIHMLCEEDYFWLEHFDSIFNSADEIVFEVDYKEIIKIYGRKGLGLDSLDDSIRSEEADDVIPDYSIPPPVRSEMNRTQGERPGKSSTIKSYKGIRPEKQETLQDRFKTLLNGGFISYSSNTFMDCEENMSYEAELIKKGIAMDKAFNSLETVEEQIEAFYTLFETEENNAPDSIDFSVVEYASDTELLRDLIKAYKVQDIELLYSLMMSSLQNQYNLDKVVYGRNYLWTDRLPEMFRNKSLFIAVGAGHLAGDRGLIKLLRKKGYTVTPVLK